MLERKEVEHIALLARLGLDEDEIDSDEHIEFEEEPCNPHETKVCFENHIHWQDSCGELEELIRTCPDTSTCDDISGVEPHFL